ncbi:MAG: hypothetical protein ABSG63_14770 [Spirochaetia bacterium]|jgi:hypothetical protein
MPVIDRGSARSGRPFIPALLLLALFAAASLPAQTLLLSVRETSGGTDLPAPLPASDGLQSSLFDRGFIVFDMTAGSPRPSTKELAAAARSSGAQAALMVKVEYTEPPRGASLSQLSATASFSLIDPDTGDQKIKGREEASNRRREKPLTLAELGREIGGRVAARVIAAFTDGKSSP